MQNYHKPLHPSADGNRSGQKGSTTPTQFLAMCQFLHPLKSPLTREHQRCNPFISPFQKAISNQEQCQTAPYIQFTKNAAYTSGVAVKGCTAKHNARTTMTGYEGVNTVHAVPRSLAVADSLAPGRFVPVPSLPSLTRENYLDPEQKTRLTLFQQHTVSPQKPL